MGVDCIIIAKVKESNKFYYRDLGRIYIFNDLESKSIGLIHRNLSDFIGGDYKFCNLDRFISWIDTRHYFLTKIKDINFNKEGIKYHIQYIEECAEFINVINLKEIEYLQIINDSSSKLYDEIFIEEKYTKEEVWWCGVIDIDKTIKNYI